MDNNSSVRPLQRYHTGMTKLFLKLMKVAPFEGGPLEAPSGTVRLLGGYSSSYLLPINEDRTAFLLVDAGVDIEAKEILAELYRQHVDANAVKAILLTHGHADHVGGINQFPAADIYVGAEDAAIVKAEQPSEDLVGKLMGKQTKTAAKNPSKLHAVKDGETLTIGNRQVRVFVVPGHTKGSVAYFIDNALFIGDAMTFDVVGRLQTPPKPVSNNIPLAIESLKKLVETFDQEAIRPAVVIPSHSGSGSFEVIRTYVTDKK